MRCAGINVIHVSLVGLAIYGIFLGNSHPVETECYEQVSLDILTK